MITLSSSHLRRLLVPCAVMVLLVLVGCFQESPTAPDRPAPDDQLVAPDAADNAHAPSVPSGWSRRKGPPSDRIRNDDGEDFTPPGKKPRDPEHALNVVLELKPGAVLETVLEEADADLITRIDALGMAVVRSTIGLPARDYRKILAKTPGVRRAQVEKKVQAAESRGMSVSFNDGFLRPGDMEDQPFMYRLGVNQAHGIASGGGVRIAILDTGVDPDHPDLAGRITGGWDLFYRDANPWEGADGRDNDEDGLVDEAYGHGTHVAGLIAMLAPSAELLIYRVLSDEGWGDASLVTQGIVRAVADGADVINLSLGMHDEFRALEKAINLAESFGVVVVTSVGNDGVETPAQFPAAYDNTIAVGSVDNFDALCTFSNYGAHLDVTAPGAAVRSISPGGGYTCWSGSSMSASIVSALCALVIERYPGAEPKTVRRRLISGVAPKTGLHGITGFGRVDFRKTLR